MPTVCFIPARGGSKRIPRKNLLPLAGKPLLAYTIDNALETGVFAEVVVSSDDDEILALAEKCGASLDRRPPPLSGDLTKFVEVLEEYLQRPAIRPRFDTFAGLLPTCPFRTAADVRSAWQLSQRHPEAFVIGVTDYDFPPQLAMTLDADDYTLQLREPDTYRFSTRSQSLDRMLHPNGSIYCGRVDRFLAEHTFFTPPMVAYAMPPERSFDIDYPYQFEIAESMMQLRHPATSTHP